VGKEGRAGGPVFTNSDYSDYVGARVMLPPGWGPQTCRRQATCPGGYLSEGRASFVLLEGANVFRRIGAGQITDVLGIVGGCDWQVLS
jgi:hypothetical protein